MIVLTFRRESALEIISKLRTISNTETELSLKGSNFTHLKTKEFKQVLAVIPSHIRLLNLQQCFFHSHFRVGEIFSLLENIQYLDLSNNKLRYLSILDLENVFANLPPNVVHLTLDNNQFEELPERVRCQIVGAIPKTVETVSCANDSIITRVPVVIDEVVFELADEESTSKINGPYTGLIQQLKSKCQVYENHLNDVLSKVPTDVIVLAKRAQLYELKACLSSRPDKKDADLIKDFQNKLIEVENTLALHRHGRGMQFLKACTIIFSSAFLGAGLIYSYATKGNISFWNSDGRNTVNDLKNTLIHAPLSNASGSTEENLGAAFEI